MNSMQCWFRQVVRLRAFVTTSYAALAALARMSRIPGLATLSLLLIAGAANAQLCSGVQSFARRPIQVRAAASFDTVSRTAVGGVRIGGRGAFGDLELGSSHIKAYDASSFVVGALIAYQVALGSNGRIQFCPAASVGFNIGPNNIQDSGVDYRANGWGLGGGIGVLATHTPQIDLLPTLSVTFVHATQRLTDNTATFTTSTSRSSEVIDLGVGFVRRQQLSFKPILSIGLPGGATGFAFALTYSLGHSE